MGVRIGSVSSTTIVNAALAQAAETICVTSPPITIPLDNTQVQIYWFVTVVLGAAATSITGFLRRGAAAAGALVTRSSQSYAVSAALGYVLSGCYVDTPGAVAGQQYSFSANQAGATGAGTINDVCLIVMAL